MTVRRSLLALGLAVVLGVALLVPRTPPEYSPPVVHPTSFDAWVAREDARAAAEGVPAEHRVRVVRRVPDRSAVAILYIHGFGAARQEGEAVVDTVGEAVAANVVYMRLPGHGGGKDAQARVTATEYLDAVDEGVAHMPLVGRKVVVVGSSTGGLLATWVAARRPQNVQALVLANPLFGFRSRLAFLGGTKAGQAVISLVEGPERDASFRTDPEQRKVPGYDDHWITHQRWEAFFTLHEVVRRCGGDETLARVQAPALLLWSPRDEVVDLAAMHRAFSRLGSARKQEVEIADGNHILLSQYVRTDKAAAVQATVAFLRDAGIAR
jgi:pimeloyl-ACP methyl ester carboxylesterase